MARELYDGRTQHLWYITHISALASTSLSLVGVFYIFFKTWRLSLTRNLDISHKLPTIISICDLIFNFHHAVDHLYSISTKRVANGGLCTWLGFGSLVGLQSSSLWILTLAIYMSSLIVFSMRIDLERYFWVVASICWGLPIIANATLAATGQIGDAGMYCMVNERISSVIMKPALFLLVFFFILLCYIAIAIKLVWHTGKSFRSSYRAELQRVGLHLIGFTAVYMLQFFPVCIIVFATGAGHTPGLALDVADKILSNGNGWMNAIAYRHFLGRLENTTAKTTIQSQDAGDDPPSYSSKAAPDSDVKGSSVLVMSETSPC